MSLVLIVVRHPESEWNVVKNAAVESGAKPLLLPGYSNTGLTPFGKVQAYLLGRFLRNTLGPLKNFVISDTIRADQALDVMVRDAHLAGPGGWVRAGTSLLMDPLFNELKKQTVLIEAEAIYRAAISKDPHDAHKKACEIFASYFLFTLKLYAKPEIVAKLLRAEENLEGYAHFTANFPDYQERIASWSSRDFQPDEAACLNKIRESVLASRKCPSCHRGPADSPPEPGETRCPCDMSHPFAPIYLELQDNHGLGFVLLPDGRVRCFPYETGDPLGQIKEFFGKWLLSTGRYTRRGPIILLISHAKRIVRMRQNLEGFDEQTAQQLLKAQGTDFPQNVSLTVYRSAKAGKWRKVGSPYMLPENIVSLGGRKLGLTISPRRLKAICQRLGVDERQVRPHLV
ncbi:MAG: histidine phosphatase family protein [Patescibacteria group bacterium]